MKKAREVHAQLLDIMKSQKIAVISSKGLETKNQFDNHCDKLNMPIVYIVVLKVIGIWSVKQYVLHISTIVPESKVS